MTNTFYITTAIDYVNAPPHIGHAYEKIITDVIARWKRIEGKDVIYLTGTDENAQKNAQAAKKKGGSTKEFVNKNSEKFEKLCKDLNLSNDDFIKTTEKRHTKVAQLIFKKIFDKGDIYKKTYSGLYCVGCEAFLTEKELVDGKCPEHKKEPEIIEEENYFFKLSKYEKEILKLVSSKDFIIPKGWRNEIVNRN
jgi:methionyl-tRNA synthetase